jgi:hypothetical protein
MQGEVKLDFPRSRPLVSFDLLYKPIKQNRAQILCHGFHEFTRIILNKSAKSVAKKFLQEACLNRFNLKVEISKLVFSSLTNCEINFPVIGPSDMPNMAMPTAMIQ